MSQITIATALTSVTNYTDAIMDNLIGTTGILPTYISGIQNFYRGLRPLGSENVKVPCFMVQAVSVDSKMITTAKYERWYAFDIYFVVGDNNLDNVEAQVTSVSELLQKLFSNNALNDISGANTNQFKAYGTNWIDSEMSRIETSPAFLFDQPGGPKYVSWGYFQLKVQKVFLT